MTQVERRNKRLTPRQSFVYMTCFLLIGLHLHGSDTSTSLKDCLRLWPISFSYEFPAPPLYQHGTITSPGPRNLRISWSNKNVHISLHYRIYLVLSQHLPLPSASLPRPLSVSLSFLPSLSLLFIPHPLSSSSPMSHRLSPYVSSASYPPLPSLSLPSLALPFNLPDPCLSPLTPHPRVMPSIHEYSLPLIVPASLRECQLPVPILSPLHLLHISLHISPIRPFLPRPNSNMVAKRHLEFLKLPIISILTLLKVNKLDVTSSEFDFR